MAIHYKRRDISVDDYHRMADAGIFGLQERVELIDGELIAMPPVGQRHWTRHAAVNRYLVETLGDRALVVPQGSFPLGERNEPQPDFAILAPADYSDRPMPALAEIVAFVELSDTSLSFDRGRKLRMYGGQRVRQYLLADLKRNLLTSYRSPNDVGYGVEQNLRYGDRFSLEALPDLELLADPFFATSR